MAVAVEMVMDMPAARLCTARRAPHHRPHRLLRPHRPPRLRAAMTKSSIMQPMQSRHSILAAAAHVRHRPRIDPLRRPLHPHCHHLPTPRAFTARRSRADRTKRAPPRMPKQVPSLVRCVFGFLVRMLVSFCFLLRTFRFSSVLCNSSCFCFARVFSTICACRTWLGLVDLRRIRIGNEFHRRSHITASHDAGRRAHRALVADRSRQGPTEQRVRPHGTVLVHVCVLSKRRTHESVARAVPRRQPLVCSASAAGAPAPKPVSQSKSESESESESAPARRRSAPPVDAEAASDAAAAPTAAPARSGAASAPSRGRPVRAAGRISAKSVSAAPAATTRLPSRLSAPAPERR